VGWVGFGWASQLMGSVRTGHTKWTHGQLWADHGLYTGRTSVRTSRYSTLAVTYRRAGRRASDAHLPGRRPGEPRGIYGVTSSRPAGHYLPSHAYYYLVFHPSPTHSFIPGLKPCSANCSHRSPSFFHTSQPVLFRATDDNPQLALFGAFNVWKNATNLQSDENVLQFTS